MAKSGYSGTPLSRKLGFKEGQYVLLVNLPGHYFHLFDELPPLNRLDGPCKECADVVHLFCTSLEDLETYFEPLKDSMKKTAMFWISWPKGSSAISTNLNGNTVRRFGLLRGLVDVKVCAVDKDWSALKFMYRTADRG